MGSLIGHAASGLFFFLSGLWHLYSNVKLYLLQPNSFKSLPWFPTAKFRYLELSLIILATSLYLVFELFVGPSNHHPFDKDGTNQLRNFQHSSTFMSFLVYAVFAILLDRVKPNNVSYGLTELLAGLAFSLQLFNSRLRSTDHAGVEGQYHMFLRPLIAVSLATTLTGIARPNSFLVSFVRSASLLFQGSWLMVTGFMLWTPQLIAKGCFINNENGQLVVRCHGSKALQRARSLVNLQFSWFLISMASAAMSLYLLMVKQYSGERSEYRTMKSDKLLDERLEGIEVECLEEDGGLKKSSTIQMGSLHRPADNKQTLVM
uniref:Uncharacterized protein n=1 Tax=Kalanchoe fedtschenkoi TaxID=63787 RepID=A0A7N0UC57_KALFE